MRLINGVINWWSELDTKPTGFRIKKMSILFSGVLAGISAILAFLTFNQQQEIKGMSNLIQKQDSTINLLTSLSSDNKDLIYQNTVMISRLDTTQRYVLSQLNAIKFQTTSEQYSTRPILDLVGDITMRRDNQDLTKYLVKISWKNFGIRPATNIKIDFEWVYFNNKNLVVRVLKLPPVEAEGLIPSNQKMELINSLNFATEEQLNIFKTYYLITTFYFFDQLTKKPEKHITYNLQYPEPGTNDPIILRLQKLLPNELKTLESYAKRKN
jgi:hypothetical protein